MKYKYTYQLYPGQGYRGLVNGKPFTGFYDERDLSELKDLLQKEEQKRQEEENNKSKPLSFREHLIKNADPEFVKDYLEYIKNKS